MVKMRIPIREQLGCLVLLSSLIGLAVIAIATWVGTSWLQCGTRRNLTQYYRSRTTTLCSAYGTTIPRQTICVLPN